MVPSVGIDGAAAVATVLLCDILQCGISVNNYGDQQPLTSHWFSIPIVETRTCGTYTYLPAIPIPNRANKAYGECEHAFRATAPGSNPLSSRVTPQYID